MNLDDFVLIEPGEYTQGVARTPRELTAMYGPVVKWNEEPPAKRAVVDKAFYLCKFETTVAQFREFVDAAGYKTNAEQFGGAYGSHKHVWFYEMGVNWRNPGFAQADDHPAAGVTYVDASAYLEWLNARDETRRLGVTFRLPSELEWEYACRAGSTTEYFWGDDFTAGKPYLNAADEAGTPDGDSWFMKFPFNNGYVGTSPVGSFQPNPWGLYDMLGNVWEWCSDEFPPDKKGKTRVVRGGSWRTPPPRCRCAFRNLDLDDVAFVCHGFRLAADPQ